MSLEREVAEYVVRIIQIEREKAYQLGYTKGRLSAEDKPAPAPDDSMRIVDSAFSDVKTAYAQYMDAILALTVAGSETESEEAKAAVEDAVSSLTKALQNHRRCIQQYL